MGNDNIIDRRDQGSNGATNHRRFFSRVRDIAKKVVREQIKSGGIKDITGGRDIEIEGSDPLEEPFFHHGEGGDREFVLPGNKKFVRGDQLQKPEGGDGSGNGNQAGHGDGQDSFIYHLSKEEFQELFFEDLELPNLEETQATSANETERVRAGFRKDGTLMSIYQTARKKKMRELPSRALRKRWVEEIEKELEDALGGRVNESDDDIIEELIRRLNRAKERALRKIPYEESDKKYQRFDERPKPISKAVMLCLMDVSGSMDERKKTLAKMFYMMLYWFLDSKYDEVELVFIRHTDEAEEVDEETFFYDTKSGGTTVETAFQLARTVIDERYPPSHWNAYIAQASDGDVFGEDGPQTARFIKERIFPLIRYMVYVEIPHNISMRETELMAAYRKEGLPSKKFDMNLITERNEVYPALRKLFGKEVTK